MEPDFSEFSYGFALTSELIARYGLKRSGAPFFPTQIAESKVGGGWDMKLPAVPVFLQFKRSERMVRSSASHSKKFPNLPFFRFQLRNRRHSDQHKLLLDLENRGNAVIYAAPAFTKSEELTDAYVADLVEARSIFISPSTIGPLTDDDNHHVAFQKPGACYFCSEPRRLEATNFAAALSPSSRHHRRRRGPPNSSFFHELANELLVVYESREKVSTELRSNLDALRQRRDPTEYAALIARTLFDAELLIAKDDEIRDS